MTLIDDMAAFNGWENFYVIVGSASGALIGLQFVVLTLIADRPPLRAADAGAAMASNAVDTSDIPEISPEQFAKAVARRGLSPLPQMCSLRYGSTGTCWNGIGGKAVAIKHASINCFGPIWRPIQRK